MNCKWLGLGVFLLAALHFAAPASADTVTTSEKLTLAAATWPDSVKPNDTLQVRYSVTLSSNAATAYTNVTSIVTLHDINNNVIHVENSVLGAYPKGYYHTFVFNLKVPTTVPNGIYYIDLALNNGSSQIASVKNLGHFDVTNSSAPAFVVSKPATTTIATPVVEPPLTVPAGMYLTLDDHFTNLNLNLWSFSFPSANVNRYGQKGLPDRLYLPSEVSILPSGGLRISCELGTYKDMSLDTSIDYNKAYLCGSITTTNSFLQMYGRFELKAKMAKGQGVWPAFWLLQNAGAYSETDIFEYLGKYSNDFHVGYFWNSLSNNIGGWTDGCHQAQANPFPATSTCNRQIPDLSNDYHLYALDWKPDSLTWYIDGTPVFTRTDHVPQNPMYVFLNQSMGGAWGGEADKTTVFPTNFDIAYLRVYQYNQYTTKPVLDVDFSNFNMSKLQVNPGDAISASANVLIGNVSEQKLTATMAIMDLNRKNTIQSLCITTDTTNPRCAHFVDANNKPITTLAAHTSYPIKLNFTLPPTLTPGVYEMHLSASATTAANSYERASAQFTVGKPIVYASPMIMP